MKRRVTSKCTHQTPPPPGLPRWFNGFCATPRHESERSQSGAESVRPPGQARWREGDARLRKGAFFNYVMVYMTIAGALMTTAGLCLHAILKAETSERRESLFLSSLQRAEQQLRRDSRESGVSFKSPTSMTAIKNEEIEVQWTSERGILTRTETRQTETWATDRFVFPAGSQIVMEQGADDSVVIRITEPSLFVTYSQSGSGSSNLNKPAETATPTTPAHVARPNFAEIHLRGAKR